MSASPAPSSSSENEVLAGGSSRTLRRTGPPLKPLIGTAWRTTVGCLDSTMFRRPPRSMLAPRGIMCHMELPDEASVGAYENFFWNWDTHNNNEPYYTSFRAEKPLQLCAEAGFDPVGCFAHLIPDFASQGAENLRRFVRGEWTPPPHGSGGWFVFGGVREG